MPEAIDSKLVVPISVQALVLSSTQENFADLRPRMKLFDQNFLGENLQPDVTKTLTLEKGMHLHWTLPKALKHAFVGDDTEMQFPYAPNRWMVIRLQTDKGIKDIPSKIWMVESDVNNKIDFKANGPDPIPNWVVLEDTKLGFKNIGKSTPWSADYTHSKTSPLVQAVGAVNPLFASFYPECKNVFGFHDDMEGAIIGSTFTYVVTGWYSDPAIDPIHPLGSTVETQKTLEWIQQQWRTNAKTYPTASVFHTTIHSVRWNENQPTGVPSGDIQVYAGNTAAESLSAQIAKSSNVDDPAIETLLNALQYELLEDERNQPSLSSIKTAVHNRSFIPKDRHITWEVLRKEANNEQLQEEKENRIHFPNNPTFLFLLNKLNESQLQFNVLSEDVERLQQEHYFLWYKQALKTINNHTVDSFDFEGSRKRNLDELVDKKVAIDLLTKEINDRVAKLKEQPYLKGPNADFELTQKLEDRFWEPNDPVLLLCGDGVGDTNGPNFQVIESKINCRTEEQLLKELHLEVSHASGPIPISISTTSFSVPSIDALSSSAIPYTIIQGVVYESLLLDHSLAIDIALLAYKKAQMERDETSDIIQTFARDVVIKEQTIPTVKDPNKRAPESFSMVLWKQAWTPLFMTWEVEYTPSDDRFEGLDLLEKTNNWTLEDGISFKSQSTETMSNSIDFQGISPFSNAVFANLKALVPEEIIHKYGKLNLIAQSLSGLHKHLLMQRPGIQLPPFIYASDSIYNFTTDFEIDQAELDVIGTDAYILGCNPGKPDSSDTHLFFPFRSGVLKIKKLSIVDVFGQVRKVIDGESKGFVTESVAMGSLKPTQNTQIPLPPRIVQPSRIQFYWLNLRDEVMYQDVGRLESPIFGWLVPNFMDNSIMVYDQNGRGVVQLQISEDFSKEKGLALAKLPFPGANQPADVSENIQLHQLLDAINAGSIVSGIMSLAQKVNESLTQARGVQNNTISLLFGQPIALARCSVGLELLGLPAFNQRWDLSGKQDSGGIRSIKFPLFIGDFSIENDGVLGYFSDTDYTRLYTPLNTPEFRFRESEPFFTKSTPLKLSLEEGAKKVTLLLDASAGVQLSSGILPSTFVEVFRHGTHEVLESIQTSFLVAPFIADKVDPGFPIPTSINTGWKWTHKSDVTTWEESQQVAEGKNKQRSSFKKQHLYEGWLTLDHLKNKE
ncbi:hypothetical protein ACFO3O_02365 [Dokdonia ponticola]|uniref:Uncharacterized protein n=1 Tax=Dokdonia ponticola TaxID=2041041 RepID=A0ABV9HSP0_9FLAO